MRCTKCLPLKDDKRPAMHVVVAKYILQILLDIYAARWTKIVNK